MTRGDVDGGSGWGVVSGEHAGPGRAFRRRGALAQHELHFGPNMTPMVDVVMVILVFFMAAASFAGPEWFLRAGLPAQSGAAQAGEALTLPSVEVRIGLRLVAVEGGVRTVADWPGARGLSLERVGVEIGLAAPGLLAGGKDAAPSVVIVPADGVAYADVVRVQAACVASGLEKIVIR